MTSNGPTVASPPPEPISKPDLPSKPLTVDHDVPLTSAQDDGQSKRPRDARLIHVVLSSLGIHSYQERVPLQLLDFAYRYTSGVLSDSLRLSEEGYINNDRGTRRTAGAAGAGGDSDKITVTALRQAIASRQGFTFQGALPKEFMMELANERNRIALPKVARGYGVQLPPEQHCLTGIGWNLSEEWESDEEDILLDGGVDAPRPSAGDKPDEPMGDAVDDGGEEDEEGGGRMEDVFGHDGQEDTAMEQD